MKDIVIVSGTQKSKEDFIKTELGNSLNYFKDFKREIFFNNKRGLGEIYNEALEKYKKRDCIIVMVHDDVKLEDVSMQYKLNQAINKFDVIGLAGTSKYTLKSPVLWHNSEKSNWSGAVAHTNPKEGPDSVFVTPFGPTPRPCIMLDGLFIAINSKKINDKIRFDERFDFHFYDLDFSITCNQNGLKVGTWPIWCMHNSHGDYQNNSWKKNENIFLQKYTNK
jgi:hypothetical protein